MFEEQSRGRPTRGVDFVVAETISHVGEASIALDVIKQAGSRPSSR